MKNLVEAFGTQMLKMYRFRIDRPLKFLTFSGILVALLLAQVHFYPALTSRSPFDSTFEFLVAAVLGTLFYHFAVRFVLWLVLKGIGFDLESAESKE